MKTITEQLRQEIKKSEHSRYAISKATGVTEETLCRFMKGTQGMTIKNLDKVALFLKLELKRKK